jgi:hypothetical protein
MAEPKTKKTRASVNEFLQQIEDPDQRKDAKAIVKLMREVTGARPKMWGPSIIGFGDYHYVYESGREGDWFLTGFSPRKGKTSIYTLCGFDKSKALLKKLGKHKTSKSCLYIKSLQDIDLDVLREIVERSIEETKRIYGG